MHRARFWAGQRGQEVCGQWGSEGGGDDVGSIPGPAQLHPHVESIYASRLQLLILAINFENIELPLGGGYEREASLCVITSTSIASIPPVLPHCAHQKATKSIHAQNHTSPLHQWRRRECHAPFTFRASTLELLRKCAPRLPIYFPHVPASSTRV